MNYWIRRRNQSISYLLKIETATGALVFSTTDSIRWWFAGTDILTIQMVFNQTFESRYYSDRLYLNIVNHKIGIDIYKKAKLAERWFLDDVKFHSLKSYANMYLTIRSPDINKIKSDYIR